MSKAENTQQIQDFVIKKSNVWCADKKGLKYKRYLMTARQLLIKAGHARAMVLNDDQVCKLMDKTFCFLQDEPCKGSDPNLVSIRCKGEKTICQDVNELYNKLQEDTQFQNTLSEYQKKKIVRLYHERKNLRKEDNKSCRLRNNLPDLCRALPDCEYDEANKQCKRTKTFLDEIVKSVGQCGKKHTKSTLIAVLQDIMRYNFSVNLYAEQENLEAKYKGSKGSWMYVFAPKYTDTSDSLMEMVHDLRFKKLEEYFEKNISAKLESWKNLNKKQLCNQVRGMYSSRESAEKAKNKKMSVDGWVSSSAAFLKGFAGADAQVDAYYLNLYSTIVSTIPENWKIGQVRIREFLERDSVRILFTTLGNAIFYIWSFGMHWFMYFLITPGGHAMLRKMRDKPIFAFGFFLSFYLFGYPAMGSAVHSYDGYLHSTIKELAGPLSSNLEGMLSVLVSTQSLVKLEPMLRAGAQKIANVQNLKTISGIVMQKGGEYASDVNPKEFWKGFTEFVKGWN